MGKLVIPSIVANGGSGGGGGEQNIKAYHAPSATLDTTLAIVIPNVDAVQEDGLYNVDYNIENEGAILNANCILSVGAVSVSGVVAQIDQTMVIGLNGSYVYLNRNYIGGQWSAWEGKNIPAELAKCLQNKATGNNSLAISLDNNTLSNSGSVIISPQVSNPSYLGNNQTIIGTSASGGENSRVICIGNYSRSYGDDTIVIGNSASSALTRGISIGHFSNTRNGVVLGHRANSNINGIAIGTGADTQNNVQSTGNRSIAIGTVTDGTMSCKATADEAIQLGNGTNSVNNQFQVYTYPMLDGNTGKIPSDRMTKVIELTATSVELASDNIYNGAELASVIFTLPATVPVNFTAQLNFTSGTTATVLSAPNTINFEGDDCTGGVFTPVASKRYQVLIASDGVNVNGYVIGR